MSWIELPELRTRKTKVFADSENPTRKRVESSIDDIHYHDGIQWQEVNEDLATDTTDGYAASSSRMRHIFRVGNTGTRRWIPRRDHPNEYVSFGRLMSWTGTAWQNVNLGTPTRVGKQISWSNAAFDLSLSVNWHKIKLLAILKTEAARRRLRWQVSLNGLTYNQGTLTSVSDSSIVGHVEKPIAWDANGSEENQNVAITTTYSGGYLEFGGNLTAAVLPITIDPTLTLDEGDGGSVDTYIYGSTATTNYGTYNNFIVGEQNIGGAARIHRTLVKFDLTDLPTDATVTSATLSLYCTVDYSDNAATFSLYRLKRAWVEAQATWNIWSTGNNWSTAGGFHADDCEQTAIGSRSMSATETLNEFKDFSLTPTTKANLDIGNGWMIKAETESNNAYQFASSDATTANTRPKLVIEYTEAAGGTDACTATDITSGTPTIETPTLTQTQVLVSTDIASGTPTLELATAGIASSEDVCVATDILSGTPTIGQSILGQKHSLTSTDVLSSAPVIETPTVAQKQALTSVDILSSAPTVEAATVGQAHNLASLEIASGTPSIETSTIGQVQALTSTDIVSGTPVIETPTIAQTNVLASLDILSGTPTAEQSTLGQTHVLVSIDILSGTPAIEQPAVVQIHGLTLADILFGTPTFEQSTIAQIHALLSSDISSGISSIELSTLALDNGIAELEVNNIEFERPEIERVSIRQINRAALSRYPVATNKKARLKKAGVRFYSDGSHDD